MKSVNDWLHTMLKSHVLPDDKVTKQHKPLVELRMSQMEELLPSVNNLFEEVKVEMAGSVQSNSKVSNTEGPSLTRILGLEKNRVTQNSS